MGLTWRRTTGLLAMACLMTALGGCKNSGLTEESYYAVGPGDVDMLWVIDNSNSMADAQVQLVQNFSAFVDALPENSTTQMGITTTQAWPCALEPTAASCDDGVGTTGRLVRDHNSPALLDPTDEDDRSTFEELAHVGINGLGFERTLQVALMAMCEAQELPDATDFVEGTDTLEENFPDGCSGNEWDTGHDLYEACHCLPREAELRFYDEDEHDWYTEVSNIHNANLGLMRGNPFHIVVLTDEGDQTSTVEALGNGTCDDMDGDELCDCRLTRLLDLIESVHDHTLISVIGPGQGPDAPEDERYDCNPMSSASCAVDFLFESVERTDGLFHPLMVPTAGDPDTCEAAELATALAELVLFHPSVEWFQLTMEPDLQTLKVKVNDEAVPAYDADSTCAEGGLTKGGYNYDPERNAFSLIGDCTAFPGDMVTVEYESSGPVMVI